MKSFNLIARVFALGAASVGTSVNAATVSYFDGAFSSGWQVAAGFQSQGYSFATTVEPSGGNTGEFVSAQHAHTQLTGGTTSGARYNFWNDAFSYDPAVHGALSTVSFAFDLKGILPSQQSAGVNYGEARPMIRQNGRTFSVATTGRAPQSDWQTFAFDFTPSDQWIEYTDTDLTSFQTVSPDFSASGAIMSFGFRVDTKAITCPGSASTTFCVADTFALGLDNYRVSAQAAVVAVPEPSTLPLAALALAGLAYGARRSVNRCALKG